MTGTSSSVCPTTCQGQHAVDTQGALNRGTYSLGNDDDNPFLMLLEIDTWVKTEEFRVLVMMTITRSLCIWKSGLPAHVALPVVPLLVDPPEDDDPDVCCGAVYRHVDE